MLMKKEKIKYITLKLGNSFNKSYHQTVKRQDRAGKIL